MFVNVVAGVDGHEGGRDATALAKELGDGQLTLVGSYISEPHYLSGFVTGFDELQRNEVLRMLAAVRDEVGAEAELLAVGDASPARALHHAAEDRGADLVVVGSAHRGRFGRILLGDVGRVVLHGAPCPVAVAPRGFQDTVRTLAVGYDGSPDGRAALELAAAFATEHNAALTVCVVWEAPTMAVDTAAAMSAELSRIEDKARERAEELLADALAALPLSTSGEVMQGRASARLAEIAAKVDLLVVGSRGWGPVRRVALGSTSDWLVHHSPCPVIVTPRPAALEGGTREGNAAPTAAPA